MSDNVIGKCGDDKCGHRWIIAYLPMDLEKCAKLMQSAACPKCANDRPYLDQSGGALDA